MKKKNILIISSVFPPEQVTSAYMNYDMARALAEDNNVTVLRPYPTRPEGIKFSYNGLEGEPFKTILVDSYTHPRSQLVGRFKESFDFGGKCADYINLHHDDVDFIYNGSWQLFGVFLVARAAVKNNIPYLLSVQDIYPESLFAGHHYPKIAQWVIKKILIPLDKYYTSRAIKVRTISQEMADYMSITRNLPKEHYVIINNWQNDEDYNVKSEKQRGKKIIFSYVGSINVHSNVELIIKAFQAASLQKAELHIFGGGNKKAFCQELAKELGCENVYFDQVSREEVPFVQAEADVMVLALPKGNGGLCLPSKMTSYMLSGKPILASLDLDSAAARQINNAKCGLAVEPDNVEALKQGFVDFYKMSEKDLLVLSRNSKEFANNYLTRKVNLKSIIDLINNGLKS